jgi:hypothetical protein
MQKFVVSVLLCAGSIAPAISATHKVPGDEPIASVTIPDSWRTREFGECVEATSPDGAVFFLVMPAERKIAESMGEAMRYLRNRGGITVKSETRKDESGKLNGMEVRNVSWQGKNSKGDVKICFAVVSVAENKPLLVAYWCSPEAEKKHRKGLDKILQSIAKA